MKMKKNDVVELHISRSSSSDVYRAIHSSLKELGYLAQKFNNRSQYGDEILLTSEQAYLLSHLLIYCQEHLQRKISIIIDTNYADKLTALDLIDHYQRTSKRFLFYSKRLKNAAKKCIMA